MGNFGEFFSNIEVFIFFSRGVQSLRQRYVARIVHGAKKGSTFVHDQTSKQTGKANILMISLNTSGKNVGCKKAYTEEVQLFLFKNTCDLESTA